MPETDPIPEIPEAIAQTDAALDPLPLTEEAAAPPPPEEQAPADIASEPIIEPEPIGASAPERFRFSKPSLLTAAETRKLRVCHDEFSRALATSLSNYLRLDLGVRIATLDSAYLSSFVAAISAPSHLTTLKLEPYSGVIYTEIPRLLAWTIIDRLLGGAGNPAPIDRPFSEIEVGILDVFLASVIDEWRTNVPGLSQTKTQVCEHESNPRFLRGISPLAEMLALDLAFGFPEGEGTIRFAFPIELVRQAGSESAQTAARVPQPEAPLRWNPIYGDIPLRLDAGWAGLTMTAGQLASLKVGDLLPMQPDYFEQVNVQLENIPKFRGRLGKCGNTWAVELLSSVEPD